MSEQEKNLRWYNLAMMAFVSVWGFGNVVNNFANQGLTVVVSWVLIIGLYFVPYALMVGELGSVFKDSKGGVSSWIRGTFWNYFSLFCRMDILGSSYTIFSTEATSGFNSIRMDCEARW